MSEIINNDIKIIIHFFLIAVYFKILKWIYFNPF